MLFSYAGKSQKRYLHGAEKNFLSRFIDLLEWLFRDRQFNFNYYAFGLNLKSTKQQDYIGRDEFLALKNKAEDTLKSASGSKDLSYDVLTKDKFVNFVYLNALKIPVVEVDQLVSEQATDMHGIVRPLESLLQSSEAFVLKNTTLEAGEGFLLCRPIDKERIKVNKQVLSFSEFKAKLRGGNWVYQRLIQSHSEIRKVNATALNTTRIVTIRDGNKIIYLTGFQSFATGTSEIDSWGQGAVYVGIEPHNNCLRGSGYYHPSFPEKAITTAHPDSGIHFDKYPMPWLSDAVDICKQAHRFFYNQFVIGWDVVITDKGPLILEANEKPGMNAVQCLDGGLRIKIKQSFKNTINYYTDIP